MSTERLHLVGDQDLPQQQVDEIPLLNQTQILFEREGGLTECYVPAELIDYEEVPVKEEWASSIARQMQQVSETKGGSGQKTPIRLGWIEGEGKFRIIDGFHRDAALRINGVKIVYATVERTDWDSLYDDRIFTAKDHAHVRFSRVVKWIQEVWQYSGLSDKLSVEQAILLYRYENVGSRIGITPEEADTAKAWVAHKEQQWDTTAMTIHSYLKTADRVDPVLVNATREKKSGNNLEAPTQQIIKIFSDVLGNDFELQNMAWLEAKKHNLKGPDVKAVCLLIQGKDVEEAKEILASTDIKNIEPAYAETKGRQLRRAADPRHKGATALKAAENEIDRVSRRVQISLDRNEPVDPEMLVNLREFLRVAGRIHQQLGELAVKVTELKDRGQIARDAENNEAVATTKANAERAYRRHLGETQKNHDRIPEQRRKQNSRDCIFAELPQFGKLSNEDWASLEPHHQLALAIDHPEVTAQQPTTLLDFCKILIRHAKINIDEEVPRTDAEFRAILKDILPQLTSQSPVAIGPVVVHDKERARLILTTNGVSYLREVVKNVKISVDDSPSKLR